MRVIPNESQNITKRYNFKKKIREMRTRMRGEHYFMDGKRQRKRIRRRKGPVR